MRIYNTTFRVLRTIKTMITTEAKAGPFSDITDRCRAQPLEWEKRPLRDRLRPVRAFRNLIAQEALALCDAVRRDIGKPADEALAGELLPLSEACRFLERKASRILRPRRVSIRQRALWLFGQTARVYRRPGGIVGIIGTWNYPIFLNGVQIIQAVTAGNSVVWKPSELGASSAEVLSNLFVQAGYPPNLIEVLPATREA